MGVAANATGAQADQAPCRAASSWSTVGTRGDATLGRGLPLVGPVAAARAAAARRVAVPLLDVVDGPAPTSDPASHPGAPWHTPVVVRVLRDATPVEPAQVVTARVLPCAHTGLLADAASLAAVGAPVGPLPRRPRGVEVAPVVAGPDARAPGPRGVSLLLGRLGRKAVWPRATVCLVEVEATAKPRPGAARGPPSPTGLLDLRPQATRALTTPGAARPQAHRVLGDALQVAVGVTVGAELAPAPLPRPLGAAKAFRTPTRAVVRTAAVLGVTATAAAEATKEGEASTETLGAVAAAGSTTGRATEVGAAPPVTPAILPAALVHGLAVRGEDSDRCSKDKLSGHPPGGTYHREGAPNK